MQPKADDGKILRIKEQTTQEKKTNRNKRADDDAKEAELVGTQLCQPPETTSGATI